MVLKTMFDIMIPHILPFVNEKAGKVERFFPPLPSTAVRAEKKWNFFAFSPVDITVWKNRWKMFKTFWAE